MCIGKENYYKFPILLREKLENQEISFPEGTKFAYESIIGYRSIIRNDGDNTPFNRNDMRSYAEKGKKRVNGKRKEDLEKDPTYYGVSLYKSLDKLAQGYKLSKPTQKVAVGKIHMEGGPEYINKAKSESHVCWWLYEDVSFESFKICEDKNDK